LHRKKLLLLIIPALTAACTTTPAAQPDSGKPVPTGTNVKLGEIPIQPDRDFFIPTMNSTVGIGLTPLYTLGRAPDSVKFTWKTNYGYFLAWDGPVKNLGREITADGKKIYWSYSPAEMGKPKPDVLISLAVSDTKTGAVLTSSTLAITWENQDTARVKK
jgi:hypothetical protein